MVDLFITLVMLFVLVKLQGETSSMVDLFIALVMLFVLVKLSTFPNGRSIYSFGSGICVWYNFGLTITYCGSTITREQ